MRFLRAAFRDLAMFQWRFRENVSSGEHCVVLGRSTMVLGRSTMVLWMSTMVLGRSTMVLIKSTMVLGRSRLDLSWLGGQGEPGECHQESVTNRRTDKQTNEQPGNYRAFPDFLNQWFSIGLMWSSEIYLFKIKTSCQIAFHGGNNPWWLREYNWCLQLSSVYHNGCFPVFQAPRHWDWELSTSYLCYHL